MHNHTPGPWLAHGLAIYTNGPIPHHTIPRSPAPRYVAQCQWDDAPQWDDNRFEADDQNMPCIEQAQANAHLIAAAPDLLSALRWLTDCISGGLESPEEMDYARPDLEHGIDEARAAIRKAMGQK